MKNIEEIKSKITEIITPVINAMGIELYDVEFSKMKSKGLLRVFIEKQDGVTIDDCERVSREIERCLMLSPFPLLIIEVVCLP
jgi:ribosome maturation factor RimP